MSRLFFEIQNVLYVVFVFYDDGVYVSYML
jgi:hypothetical protein